MAGHVHVVLWTCSPSLDRSSRISRHRFQTQWPCYRNGFASIIATAVDGRKKKTVGTYDIAAWTKIIFLSRFTFFAGGGRSTKPNRDPYRQRDNRSGVSSSASEREGLESGEVEGGSTMSVRYSRVTSGDGSRRAHACSIEKTH